MSDNDIGAIVLALEAEKAELMQKIRRVEERLKKIRAKCRHSSVKADRAEGSGARKRCIDCGTEGL